MGHKQMLFHWIKTQISVNNTDYSFGRCNFRDPNPYLCSLLAVSASEGC